jgi:hypothetical protein
MSQYGSNSCDTLPQTNFFINSYGPNTPKKHIAFISTGHIIIIGPTGFTYFNSPFTESTTFHTSPLTHDDEQHGCQSRHRLKQQYA